MSEDLSQEHANVDWEGADFDELKQAQWGAVVTRELKRRKMRWEDIEAAPKAPSGRLRSLVYSGLKPLAKFYFDPVFPPVAIKIVAYC